MKKFLCYAMLVTAAVAMGFSACTRDAVSEEVLVGSWLQEDDVYPAGNELIVWLNAKGDAYFNHSSGCFGEGYSLHYRWRLDGNGCKVCFDYEDDSRGLEMLHPDVEWEVKRMVRDTLWVAEKYLSADGNKDVVVPCKYVRQLFQ